MLFALFYSGRDSARGRFSTSPLPTSDMDVTIAEPFIAFYSRSVVNTLVCVLATEYSMHERIGQIELDRNDWRIGGAKGLSVSFIAESLSSSRPMHMRRQGILIRQP